MSATDPVFFSGGKPSNFYIAPIVLRCPVTLRPRKFESNERYFHVAKLVVSPIGQEEREEIAKLILRAPSSTEAKRLGKQRVYFDDDARVAWDEQYAPVAMLTCNIAKFRRHAACRAWLMSTGNRPLVEHRPDPIWGDGLDGSGKNLLGKTLMLVRDVLR